MSSTTLPRHFFSRPLEEGGTFHPTPWMRVALDEGCYTLSLWDAAGERWWPVATRWPDGSWGVGYELVTAAGAGFISQPVGRERAQDELSRTIGPYLLFSDPNVARDIAERVMENIESHAEEAV